MFSVDFSSITREEEMQHRNGTKPHAKRSRYKAGGEEKTKGRVWGGLRPGKEAGAIDDECVLGAMQEQIFSEFR
jgi:hypothetical protein